MNRENLLTTSLTVRESSQVSWSAGSFWSYLWSANSDLAFLSPLCIVLKSVQFWLFDNIKLCKIHYDCECHTKAEVFLKNQFAILFNVSERRY